MLLPRRSLIRAALGTAAALAIRPGTALAEIAGGLSDADAGQLDYAGFAAQKRTWFFFANQETPVAGKARLIDVVALSMQDGVEQYQLRFMVQNGLELPEGRYHVSNWRGLPEFDVYVKTQLTRRGRQVLNAYFAQLT